MIATAERTATERNGRDLVASEVRAVIARKNLTSNSLPAIAGRTQSYWYSRLQGKVAFSSDDLASLSAALNIPMSAFVPTIVASDHPHDDSPVDIATRRRPGNGAGRRHIYLLDSVGLVGHDPTTSTVESQQFMPVISLDDYRSRARPGRAITGARVA